MTNVITSLLRKRMVQ